MTVTLRHKDLTIDIFDDIDFVNSTNNSTLYDKVYRPIVEEDYLSVCQTAINIYRDETKISSAILLSNLGASATKTDSAIIDNDNIITRSCNTVFSLTIPDLTLNWKAEADLTSCFSIHKYQDSFITHGETSISRIDKYGNLMWRFSGADIFVTLYDGTPFEMHDSYISLTDFNGSKYKIDYDGQTINYEESDYHKQKPVTLYLKSEKPWWKFW